MEKHTTNTPFDDGLQVINAALFRMGTKSMAEAYKILGYRTHHAMDNTSSVRWDLLEKAAEGKWPDAPNARPHRKFTRDDWQELWGAYDVVTDVSSPFSVDLAEVYPEAKVVIVQRDFDSWWDSFQSENLAWRFFPGAEAINTVMILCGMRAGEALGKAYYGLFQAKDVTEIRKNAREAYDRYFDEIRNNVAPERRLEYKLGSGWEPLCSFLGKEIPSVPFPRVNDRASHRAETSAEFRRVCWEILRVAMPWIAAAGSVGYVWWTLAR